MSFTRIFAFLLFLPPIVMPAQDREAIAQLQSAGIQTDQGPVPPVLLLDDVIREALEKSPEVQSAMHRINALERRVSQEQALPDPIVSVGWAGNLAPFSLQHDDPSSNRSVAVSEQFPYPGKLKLRGEIASKEADSAQADYEGIRRSIAAEVRTAYFDYFYLDRAIQTTERNKELLEKLSKTAEARYRVGKATQADALRSQVEISLLIEKVIKLEQQKAMVQARLNTSMLRSPESPLPPAAEVEPATIQYSLDELYALAADNDTAVMRNKTMIERGRLASALAHKEYRPDIGVTYMYQQRSGLPRMNGLTVAVNIPVFYKTKQRQGEAEAREDLISAQKMSDNRLNEVKFELEQQYLGAKASERLFTLYGKGIIPQSSLALESSIASYQVGNADFLSLIANFSTLLNYEIDYYRQLSDYRIALTRIEALSGVDVTAQPASTSPSSDPQSEKEPQ